MAVMGYELSEQFDSPVMLRMTTRVCHSKSLVEFGDVQEPVSYTHLDVYKRQVEPRPYRGLRKPATRAIEAKNAHKGAFLHFSATLSAQIAIHSRRASPQAPGDYSCSTPPSLRLA